MYRRDSNEAACTVEVASIEQLRLPIAELDLQPYSVAVGIHSRAIQCKQAPYITVLNNAPYSNIALGVCIN